MRIAFIVLALVGLMMATMQSAAASEDVVRRDLHATTEDGARIFVRELRPRSWLAGAEPIILLHGARVPGLASFDLPVAGGYQSPEEIAAFAKLLEELPRPLLVFCRSGARSTRLFLQASQL